MIHDILQTHVVMRLILNSSYHNLLNCWGCQKILDWNIGEESEFHGYKNTGNCSFPLLFQKVSLKNVLRKEDLTSLFPLF